MAASLHNISKSLPEYPSLFSATTFKSASVNKASNPFILFFNKYNRASKSGKGIYILFSNLLLKAESSDHGRLVAPKTNTLSFVFPTPYI